MKNIKVMILLLGFAVLVASCDSFHAKSAWTEKQKTMWKKRCLSVMEETDVDNADAEKLCDCMLEKISDEYTPQEVTHLTDLEEQQIRLSCEGDEQ